MASFYCELNDKVVGPLTGVELREAALAGVVSPQTQVASSSAGPWTMAGNARGLFAPGGVPLPHPPGTYVPTFHVRTGDGVAGPFLLHQLIRFAKQRQLSEDAYLRSQSDGDWFPAGKLCLLETLPLVESPGRAASCPGDSSPRLTRAPSNSGCCRRFAALLVDCGIPAYLWAFMGLALGVFASLLTVAILSSGSSPAVLAAGEKTVPGNLSNSSALPTIASQVRLDIRADTVNTDATTKVAARLGPQGRLNGTGKSSITSALTANSTKSNVDKISGVDPTPEAEAPTILSTSPHVSPTVPGHVVSPVSSSRILPPPRLRLPELGDPPALPEFPRNLSWEKSDRNNLERVMANYLHDQISLHLTVREMLNRERNSPRAEQRRWLDSARETTQKRAADVLRLDFNNAVAAGDLRTAIVAAEVASKLQEDLLPDVTPSLLALKSKVVANTTNAAPLWEIRELRCREIPRYVEGNVSFGQTTVSAKDGFCLLRVTGEIKTIGNGSDPPYTQWAMAPFRRFFASFSLVAGSSQNAAGYWVVDEFVWLLTPAGDWISPSHVCEGCSAFRGSIWMTPQNGRRAVFGGSRVEPGTTFDLDLLFIVPKEVADFRLLFLGAPPQQIAFGDESP